MGSVAKIEEKRLELFSHFDSKTDVRISLVLTSRSGKTWICLEYESKHHALDIELPMRFLDLLKTVPKWAL